MKQGYRVVLGVILGAHGVRGEVRLKSFTADPTAIAHYGAVRMGERREEVFIRNLRRSKQGFIAALEGICDRNAAQMLKGLELHVPRHRLPPAEEGETYVADLVGLAAMQRDGSLVGKVVGMANFGAGDLLEIALPDPAKTIFIPFVKAMVPEIDLAAGRIVIDLPHGLIDAQLGPR
jgi:16S rRNA processing protein RimM